MEYTWMNELTQQLPKGAFLMVDGNPMTIGWAQYGILWSKPCLTVFVRESRHTFSLLQKSDTFTVSMPALSSMQQELGFCGSHSGRDVNKAEQLQLSLRPSHFGGQEGLSGCKLHIECKTLYRAVLHENEIDDETIRSRYYKDGDEHTMFIGEILGVWEEDA